MDGLVDQANEYSKIFVKQLVNLRPNLILVEKSLP